MSNSESFHWICPHCRRETTVVPTNIEQGSRRFSNDSAQGHSYLTWQRIRCPSPQCLKYEFIATLTQAVHSVDEYGRSHYKVGKPIGRGQVRVLPRSSAEAFPAFVPEAICTDYEEACDIVELSPKASATLARRALRGIVRDFWGATGRTLKDEIDSVRDRCDHMVWDAMEAVRKVGNIGAHMERNVDTFIDVEPVEARMLIELIETLVHETYEAREARTARMRSLKALAESKTVAKTP